METVSIILDKFSIFMPKSLRDGAGRLKGRQAVPTDICAALLDPAKAFPISTAIAIEKSQPKNPVVGELYNYHGVYLSPFEVNGVRYAVFAAPEDLTKGSKRIVDGFDKVSQVLSGKKLWYCHIFQHYKTSDDLFDAIADESGLGKWVIPMNQTVEELFKNKDEGAFKDTFATARNVPHGYWSLTTCHVTPNWNSKWTTDFENGKSTPRNRNLYKMNFRMVRFERLEA
jgi:hypothetical protein